MTNKNQISYKSTVVACCTGSFVQAIVINLTPILFIPLKEQFGLSYEQLGLLILINFLTQEACDLLFSTAADKYGFRPFIASAHILVVAGFLLFALSPVVLKNPYPGFIVATIVFSGAGGLLELLLSPIVNAIPTDGKASAMSILHSFYAWGQVTVVLLTTLFLFAAGRNAWPLTFAIWSIIPLFNFFMFLKVPMGPQVPAESRQGMRELIWKPFFVLAFMAILFGGATEIIIGQWASAFLEEVMAIPKVVGDIAGICMFAVMLGMGRLFYGIYGKKINVIKVMIPGALLAVTCYIIIAFSSIDVLTLVACALSGLAVSLLWPGTLVLASERFPLAGAWLFAILAAGGDIGASAGPWLVSVITDHAPQYGLRMGILVAVLFPVGALASLFMMRRSNRKMLIQGNA